MDPFSSWYRAPVNRLTAGQVVFHFCAAFALLSETLPCTLFMCGVIAPRIVIFLLLELVVFLRRLDRGRPLAVTRRAGTPGWRLLLGGTLTTAVCAAKPSHGTPTLESVVRYG